MAALTCVTAVQSHLLDAADRYEDRSTSVEFITTVSAVTVNTPFYTRKVNFPSGWGSGSRDGGMGLMWRSACPQDLLSSYMSNVAWMSGSSISQTTLRGGMEFRLKKLPPEKK